MIDRGPHNIAGVRIDAVDTEAATQRVIDAAHGHRGFAATALAVHGVMEAVADPVYRHRINDLDLVTADGQAVRWGLNLLHATGLPDRCYGPTVMLQVCARAEVDGLSVFLYGSTPATLVALEANLRARFPGLEVAGVAPSRFEEVSATELDRIADAIAGAGPRLVFVGLGCPRQEVFVHEMRSRLPMPLVAVGAAFDYHAGTLREPPQFVQRVGLQWLWRLCAEPGRLWRRYARTNPAYLWAIVRQRWLGWEPPLDDGVEPTDGTVPA